MEYHEDRFSEYSLMIYKDDVLFALLPANRNNDIIYSHQGLSYGGLLLLPETKFEAVFEAFKTMLHFLNDNGMVSLELKLLPKIYHKFPSDEIDYLMFKSKAKLVRRDVSSVLDMQQALKFRSSNRKRNLKKAKLNGIEVKELEESESFF